MTLAFQEHQPLEKWVSHAVWAAIAVYTFFLLAAMLILHPPLLILVLTLLSIPPVIFLALNFRSLNIRIDDDRISFGFGIFRKSVRWDEIQSVSLQPYLFSRFLGWGICLDLRGTIGFIARRSMGVQLTLKSGRKYFFSTSHPRELADLISTRIQRTQGKAAAEH